MTQHASFATFHSTRGDSTGMLDELAAQMDAAAFEPNLVIAFLAEHSEEAFGELSQSLRSRFPEAQLAGCSCQGTVCDGQEFENGPSAVVWTANLADVDFGSFQLNFQRTSEGAAFAGEGDLADMSEWEPTDSALIALGDPYTFPMDVYLDRLREEAPLLPVVGGMASGGSGPGLTLLMRNGQLINHGAVFLSLRNRRTDGLSRFVSVVSQGCRPIGEPLIVTSAERNQIFGLGGKPAVEQLLRIYRELPTQEQRMLQLGLHLGIAVDEYRDRFGFGDFLIRNVMQLNHDEGYLVVGDFVRVGQTVQFHLRDEVSASSDLGVRLRQMLAESQPQRPAGALLFSCNGRGQNLFSAPSHDAELVRSTVGEIPLAGFFAAGEIGPVSGVNFVHGFTASGLFFRA